MCIRDSLQGDSDGIELKKGDVLDVALVREAARGCDGAIHCAGKVSRDARDTGELRRVHVGGTRALLDACEAEGVARVVVVSTSGTVAVSEDPDHVATEDDPTPYLSLIHI